MIRQLSIFIQNDKGRLSHVLKILYDNDINIRTLTVVDTFDYGIVRLIIPDIDKAERVLKEHDIMVNETHVFAAEIEDRPGGMYNLIQEFSGCDINVEYAYSYSQKKTQNAIIIFKVKEEDRDKVKEILKDHETIRLLNHEELMQV